MTNSSPISRGLTLSFSTLAVTLSCLINPVLAGDPFRTNNPNDYISDRTESAFEAIFQEGNYPQAKTLLTEESLENTIDPLPYAMIAALAYTEEDWTTFQTYGGKTLEVAQQLTAQDPLRGHLYTAVGHFLEGAYIYKTESPLDAVTKLQQVFRSLDQAEKIDPNDPELSLIKGYMDLMLAINLPFSSPENAIAQFQENAAPLYLVDRGIAVAYRDLEQYEKALTSVNKALALTPDNPELYYLRAQILYHKGKETRDTSLLNASLADFDRAYEKRNQLPAFIVEAINRERRLVEARLTR